MSNAIETRHGPATGVVAVYDEDGTLLEIVLMIED